MKAFKLTLSLLSLSVFAIACSVSVNNSNSSSTASTLSANQETSSAPTAQAPVDELAAAKKIYSDKCVRCHKEDGKGGVTDIDGEKIKAPDFTKEKMKKHADEEFIDVITNGESGEGMPAFKGKLTEDEIKSLVKLIRRDFQNM